MRSLEKLKSIYRDIMIEMYQKADPPLDIVAYEKELKEKGELSPEGWFLNHYLPIDEQEAIVNKHFDKHRLTKRERHELNFVVHLGWAPRGVKKDE